MVDKPSFYAILPADVRYAEDLTSLQKILYAEITALTNKEGYCYAGNSYFAELYKKDPTRVSKTISDMQKKGYLQVSREKESGFVRRIYVGELKELKKTIKTTCRKLQKASGIKTQDPSCSEVQGGIEEKCKTPLAEKCNIIIQDNNTTRNNTLSSNEESILKDTKQEKKSKNSSSLKNLEEEKEKSSAKKEKNAEVRERNTKILELIKQKVESLGLIYKAGEMERISATNICTAKVFGSVAEKFGLSPPELAIAVIEASAQDQFRAGKIYNAETVYKHYEKVINQAKASFQKKQNQIAKVKRV